MYHSMPAPTSEQGKRELKEKQEKLVKDAARSSVPCVIMFKHASIKEQVDNLSSTNDTMEWLQALMTELNRRLDIIPAHKRQARQ